MDRPFESDLMDDAALEDLAAEEGGEGLDSLDDTFAAPIAGDEFEGDEALGDSLGFEGEALDAGEAMGEGVDDMALWDAFEEEVADGLDAADDDEFLGRLMGGLGRAAGVLGRAAGAAGQVSGMAQRAGRIAGQVGRVASRVSPAATAAARLARMLGAPGVASALGTVGRSARTVGRAAGHARGLAGSVGQAAGGAQGLFSQLSQLLGGGDSFDAAIDLYEEGVDEALPAVVGLAARAAARGLGLNNVAQLSATARRSLVRGVAAAARELARSRVPQAMRTLPRLAMSTARVARRRAGTAQRAAQAVRQALPRTARSVAQNPRAVQRVARAPAPLSRPANLGHGVRSAPQRPRAPRTFNLSGPVTVTIAPR